MRETLGGGCELSSCGWTATNALKAFHVKDPYDVNLGTVVRHAYRRYAIQCHPDKNADDAAKSTATFQILRNCYSALQEFAKLPLDARKRLLESEAPRCASREHPDATVTWTLEEIYHGTYKTVRFERRARVPREVCKLRVHVQSGQPVSSDPVKATSEVSSGVFVRFRVAAHSRFERIAGRAADLAMHVQLKASEIVNNRYNVRFTHLNGRDYDIPLAVKPSLMPCERVLKSMGMPVYQSDRNQYGNLIVFLSLIE